MGKRKAGFKKRREVKRDGMMSVFSTRYDLKFPSGLKVMHKTTPSIANLLYA